MAAGLIADPEIAARFAPFCSVRWDAAAAGTGLGQQMSQLMAESAIYLRGIVLAESRIQGDEVAARIGSPGGAEEAGVPFDAEFARELVGSERAQDFLRSRFEGKIAAQHHERGASGENKVELAGAGLVVQFQGAAV
ncbi:MAG TPA: hypothetical protein VF626_07920 [Chthoniobacterales bacterium]